jgi:hypothetical protein
VNRMEYTIAVCLEDYFKRELQRAIGSKQTSLAEQLQKIVGSMEHVVRMM